MTIPWIDSLKPAAPARVHLLLAAVMWSAVGATLITVGALWALQFRMPATPWLISAAVAGGWLKARLVLARAGHRIADRITDRGDGRCIGGFLSLRSWALVLVMVVAGRLLRGGVLTRHLVGLLYVLVGTGLVVASRTLWRAWAGSRPRVPARCS